MIFVNFKTYEAGSGLNALNLVKILATASSGKGVKIIPVLQAADIKEATQTSKLEIWAQNIDPNPFGASTGSTLAEAVYEDGAIGTFLNHSEHKFTNFNDLEMASKRAKEVGLKTLIFAADENELGKVVSLKPDFVSYEPPELVGSKTTSVSQSRPETIAEAVQISRKEGIPLIVGAGIKSADDVKKSLELGATGVAVASAVVEDKDPAGKLTELMEGFK